MLTTMNINSWRVALLYNLSHPASLDPDMPTDALADYDSIETVQAVEMALHNVGHQVIPLEADHTLLDSIRHVNPDICFNMAHGVEGHYRESQIPAILDMLNIPYTGSGVLTLARSRDRAELKRICHAYRLPTAPSQVMGCGEDELDGSLSFPLIVKPLHGKLGMGISADSVVYDHVELNAQVDRITNLYRQPALVETFLPGREFVVGVIGNGSTMQRQRDNHLYGTSGYHCLPVLEIDSNRSIGEGIFSSEARALSPKSPDAPVYTCPANIKGSLKGELASLGIAAFEAIGACDVARIDFRLDASGSPHILSINALPSLDPYQSVFAQMAWADDMSYYEFVSELLNLALERHCLTPPEHHLVNRADVPAGMPVANYFETLLVPAS